MPAIERDQHYRQLLSQLALHPADRANLHRRGLSDEQISAWGVKSVEQWQRLERELPHELTGVSLDGQSLITPRPGYLCPIQDVDGLIVGFQLRSRTSDSQRYSWLTGKTKKRPAGPTPHLSNGELPLVVHRPFDSLRLSSLRQAQDAAGQAAQGPPQAATREAIALVEGLGAKPSSWPRDSDS